MDHLLPGDENARLKHSLDKCISFNHVAMIAVMSNLSTV